MADEQTKPIDDILSEGRETTEDVSKVEERPSGQARDEHGRFAKADQQPAQGQEAEADQAEAQPPPEQSQPADPDPNKPENWSYAAFKDEKQKRQDAEKRIAAAEERAKAVEREMMRIRAEQARAQQQPEQPIDPFANPEGFAKSFRDEVENTKLQLRREVSLENAHHRHGETFEKAWTAFEEAAYAGDAALATNVLRSSNPGETIVKWYREREALNTIGGDPAKWAEEERAKIREEVLAELNGGQSPASQAQPSPQPQAQMPTNLAGARNVGTRSGPAWEGPASIGDIFNRKRAKA